MYSSIDRWALLRRSVGRSFYWTLDSVLHPWSTNMRRFHVHIVPPDHDDGDVIGGRVTCGERSDILQEALRADEGIGEVREEPRLSILFRVGGHRLRDTVRNNDEPIAR